MKAIAIIFSTIMVVCCSCSKDAAPPVGWGNLHDIATSGITNISSTSAVGGGIITVASDAEIQAKGICYSTRPSPTTRDSVTRNGSGTASFSSSLYGLKPATTYYVRAYITTSAITAYGEERQFRTNAALSSISTAAVNSVSRYSAASGGYISSDGGSSITARGVCWSVYQNPTISNSKTSNGSGTGNYSSYINGLTSNTTYYVRAYATNQAGTAYGPQVQFRTLY